MMWQQWAIACWLVISAGVYVSKVGRPYTRSANEAAFGVGEYALIIALVVSL